MSRNIYFDSLAIRIERILYNLENIILGEVENSLARNRPPIDSNINSEKLLTPFDSLSPPHPYSNNRWVNLKVKRVNR